MNNVNEAPPYRTMPTIGDEQAKFQQWFEEWQGWDTGAWKDKTPESLLSYFKTRLCVTLGALPNAEG